MKKLSFLALVLSGMVILAAPAARSDVAITTYHNDPQRTGWNSQENILTATNFPRNFGILKTVSNLDDQTDAQPLVIPCSLTTTPGCTLDSTGHGAVVYVATEGNTVYAIDSVSGNILLSKNLGIPVSEPLGCNNNGPHVGIDGTPVTDGTSTTRSTTFYVIAYVNGTPPTYYLHALNLTDFSEKTGSPVPINASNTYHTLHDGSTYSFNTAVQRQRPGLLLQNGNVYAAFGSFCDYSAAQSRGWILGWSASTLTALTANQNQLNDTQTSSDLVADGYPLSSTNTPFFLTSIWMSGYGVAGDGTNLYFSTGNSDCNYYVSGDPCPSTSTWQNPPYHIQESVVSLSGGLALNGTFTPTTSPDTFTLDQNDEDLGSGGVLVLPQQVNGYNLAAAAGKDGRLFLLNRNNLSSGPITLPPGLPACWCGPSFFIGSDNVGRIVTSHGTTLQIWRVLTSPSGSPTLAAGASATVNSSSQDGGFFTWVSSNGQPSSATNAAIVWAVGRPTSTTTGHGRNKTTTVSVNLYAFEFYPGGTFTQLFSGSAGSWPNTGGNSNIVPVVANGKVYVASAYLDSSGNTRGQLNIFGAGGTGKPVVSAVADPISPHVISGVLIGVSGSTLTVQTRDGGTATVNASRAIQNQRVGAPLKLGTKFTALGSTIEANGALLAMAIVRAKGVSGDLWPPDK